MWLEGGISLSAHQGVIPASASNPASTTAGQDYTFNWAFTNDKPFVRHILLQNNTSTAINYDFDTPATAGSLLLGSYAMVWLDISCSTLHFFNGASGFAINGSSASNIVVRAWA